MISNHIKQRIQAVIEETLQGVICDTPEVKVTDMNELLTDDEKLVNEIMEENMDGVLHVETTLKLSNPIEYITVTFKIDE